MKSAWVYIMGSATGVLYIGVTSDLDRRISEHKNGIRSGFPSRYRCYKLIYFENYQYLTTAIARETTLKGWKRERKLELIRSTNPEMQDLAKDWGTKLPTPSF